ncbi:MAG: hypothetical protein HOI33_11120 [Rhodospirillaceae bacterium]|jgi:hypothetical protein|nr:hypothetical protein [Rhodospirillaceae bacterium]MBT5659113.1 hypothetical protein [Rhodospirillaceae bacterium]MBT5753240.1 hypothetical protein [Rhodospirillaceae bacterium]
MSEESNAGSKDEVIKFDHPFFEKMKEGYFRKASDGVAVFVVKMAEDEGKDHPEVLLPFKGIKREFGMEEDSPDASMLDMVDESLKFIKVLRVGDAIPLEVLTGEASWEVSDRDRNIAYQRITLQLVTWMTGDEMKASSPEDLMQLVENEEIKTKINEAFEEAAEKMGLGRDNKEEVVNLIGTLAEELAHIEALRTRFEGVIMMVSKIRELGKVYSNEKGVLEYLQPITQLIIIAKNEYQALFDQIDAQTGEIIAVLRNIGAQTKYIHQVRDDLYCRLIVWDEMFKLWKAQNASRSLQTEELLRKTYQFLAPRFMQEDKWVLFSQLQDKKGEMKTAMRW